MWPEAMYDAMTSGSPGTVHTLAGDVDQSMTGVAESIDLVALAQDKPDWDSPSARTHFNMRAWATRASAEVCFIRLNRTKLALDYVSGAYSTMVADATEQIDYWRAHKNDVVDTLGMLLLLVTTTNNLATVRSGYSDQLSEAADFLTTDPFGADQQEWLERGLVKSMIRDLEHGTLPGPAIPNTLATDNDDDGWTPQGLGYDPASGNLIQTSYNADGGAELSVIDPATGKVLNTVQLGAAGDDGVPVHVGGVAVHDGTVWVTSSGSNPTVHQYDLDTINAATPSTTVPAQGPPQTVAAGSSCTVSGNTLYVGDFKTDTLHTYTWDLKSGSWGNEQGPFKTPDQTQGMAVRGNEIVFSSSEGRGNAGALTSYNLNDVLSGGELGDPLQTVELPTMSEGVIMLPDGVVTTYESGSSGYSSPFGSASLADLWAGLNMTVTPYGDLGLAGTIEVVPLSLEQASSQFRQAESGMDTAQGRLARLSLPARCLGEAPAAPAFATTVTTHLDTTAVWLGEARVSADLTASGLVGAARDYTDSDHHGESLFGMLQDLLS